MARGLHTRRYALSYRTEGPQPWPQDILEEMHRQLPLAQTVGQSRTIVGRPGSNHGLPPRPQHLMKVNNYGRNEIGRVEAPTQLTWRASSWDNARMMGWPCLPRLPLLRFSGISLIGDARPRPMRASDPVTIVPRSPRRCKTLGSSIASVHSPPYRDGGDCGPD